MAKRDTKGSYTVWFMLKSGKRARWTFHTLKARDAGETNIKNLIDLASGIETRETRDSLKWALEQKTKDEKLYSKLVEWGLIEDDRDREKTIGDLQAHFQKRGVKAATLLTYKDAFQNLIDFFGADKPLQAITPQDASDFEHYLRTTAYNGAGYSKATVKKRLSRIKQFTKEARRLRWLNSDPFEGIQGGNLANVKKWLYIPRETVLDVMANTPDLQTRARIALCRFAGARGKSEFDSLEWNSNWIQWSADGKQGTVRLHRQKTEDSGYSDTIIPMVPELEAVLRDLFDSAAPGTIRVFKPVNNPGKTIKDQFRRNGVDILEPYNLRRSFCRDLMERGLDAKSYEYFCGHSLKVSLQFYQSWDDLRAQKAAPKVLEALTGSDSHPNRRADRRAEESSLESRNRLSSLADFDNFEPQVLINKEHSQEMKKPLQKVARATDRGDWNLTDGERALFLRGFCNTQNLGEQFGEQTAIFEQVLTLFEKLDADRQAALLETLTAKIQSAAGISR